MDHTTLCFQISPDQLKTLLSFWEHQVGLIKRIGTSYLMRDACPSCFRRVCHSDCHLHMSVTDFAPRRETQLPIGA